MEQRFSLTGTRQDAQNLTDEAFFARHLRKKNGVLPLVSSSEAGVPTQAQTNTQADEHSSIWDLIKAHVSSGTIIDAVRLSFIKGKSFYEPDPSFEIRPEDCYGYEEYMHDLCSADNREQLNALKTAIDDIRLKQKIKAEHGIVANLGADLLSPESWLTLGGAGKAYNAISQGFRYWKYGKKLSSTASTFVEHIFGKDFYKTAAAAVVQNTASNAAFGATLGAIELGIQATLGSDLSGEQMLKQITTPALLGAGFGVIFGTSADLLLRRKTKLAAERYKALLQDPNNKSIENITVALDPLKAGEPGYLSGKVKSALGQELPITPGIRTSTSPSLLTRDISRKLVDNFITFVDNDGNVLTNNAASVESVSNKLIAVYGTKITDEINKGFKSWLLQRYGNLKAFTELAKREVWGNSRQWDEFNALLAEAARNGDTHIDPIVNQTAKSLRPISDEIGNLAQKYDLYGVKSRALSENQSKLTRRTKQREKLEQAGGNQAQIDKIKQEELALQKQLDAIRAKTYTVQDFESVGDASYLPRAFDKNKIANNLDGFRACIKRGMISQLKQKGLFEGQKLNQREQKIFNSLNQKLDDATALVLDEILKTSQGRVRLRNYGIRGFENERVLKFPTKYVQDFVVNHYADTMYRYLQTVIPDTQIMKSFGTLEVDDLLVGIAKDYGEMIQNAEKLGKKTEVECLLKNLASDKEDIEAMFNRVRGTSVLDPYNLTAGGRVINNMIATVQNLNVARLLGGTTMAGANDLGQVSMVLGFKRFFGTGLKMLIHMKWTKQALKDNEALFNASTLWRQTRQASFGEMVGGSGFWAWAAKASRGFANATTYLSGIHFWDDTMKFLAGYQASEIILKAGETLLEGKALAAKDAHWLQTLGLSEPQLKKIHEQFTKHGEKRNGLYAPGSAKWTDNEAKSVFGAAIMKIQNQAILTPGIGTVPVLFDNPKMKMFTQFRRFTWSAFEKCMIPGLQKRDFDVFVGATMMMCIGVLRSTVRMYVGGYSLSDEELLDQALKECDFMSYYGDIYGTAKTLFGFDEEQNKANADFMRSIQGTIIGFGVDSFGASRSLLKLLQGKPLTQGEVHAMRKMLPSQNNPVFAGLFNRAEDQVFERFGNGKRRKK